MLKKILFICELFLTTSIVGQNNSFKPFDISFDSNFIIQKNTELSNLFSSKNIIAVGEATHGSKEFIFIRQSIFKYLNSNSNTNVILLELPQSVAFWLNDYIHNKISFQIIDSIFKKAKPYYSKEFFNFLDDIKRLNFENKIYIGGFDPDQNYHFATSRLHHLLSNYDKQINEHFTDLISQIVFIDTVLKETDKYKNETVKTAIDTISNYLNSFRKEFTDEDFFEIQQCLSQYENTYKYWNTSNIYRHNLRDRLMADKIEMLSNYFINTKLLIWAHNNHIRNSDGIIMKPFGELLKNKFGDKYLSIGTVFSEGSYRVWYNGILSIKNLKQENSGDFTKYLNSLNQNYILINKKDLPDNIRKSKTQIHDVGIIQTTEKERANKYSLNPDKDFDMYIYITQITSYDL